MSIVYRERARPFQKQRENNNSQALSLKRNKTRETGNKMKKNKYGRQAKEKTAPFARVLGDAEPSNMASRTSMASKSGKISWVMEVSENGELKPFFRCNRLLEAWTRYRKLDILYRMRMNQVMTDLRSGFSEKL